MRVHTGEIIHCEMPQFDTYKTRPNILVAVTKNPSPRLKGKWVHVHFNDSSYMSSLCLNAQQCAKLIDELKEARRHVVRRMSVNFKGSR